MNLRDELIRAINKLPDEAIEGVLDYVRFIQEPEEIEPTEADLKAITLGEEAYAKGDYVKWKDIRNDAV
jgi:hypothetical protein